MIGFQNKKNRIPLDLRNQFLTYFFQFQTHDLIFQTHDLIYQSNHFYFFFNSKHTDSLSTFWPSFRN